MRVSFVYKVILGAGLSSHFKEYKNGNCYFFSFQKITLKVILVHTHSSNKHCYYDGVKY